LYRAGDAELTPGRSFCSTTGLRSDMSAASPKLIPLVRSRLRLRHMSLRTEQAYLDWIRRFVRYHGVRHPQEMGEVEVIDFLSDLAERRGVASST